MIMSECNTKYKSRDFAKKRLNLTQVPRICFILVSVIVLKLIACFFFLLLHELSEKRCYWSSTLLPQTPVTSINEKFVGHFKNVNQFGSFEFIGVNEYFSELLWIQWSCNREFIFYSLFKRLNATKDS